MPGCTFVTRKDKKDSKKDVLCGLLQQEGSVYCPRHTFLHSINAQAEHAKAVAKWEEKQGNPTGGMPKTREELLQRGYQFVGNRDCGGCHSPIELWSTPSARMAPFNPMPDIHSHALSHFATCTRAHQFRRAG